MRDIRFAILGAGNIAHQMGRTIAEMEGVDAYAVASRDREKAWEFSQEYGFSKAYGSYDEMLEDEAVDLVYIATPISHHYEHITRCLEHGKHVLCEKAFTTNAREARAVTALAQEKQLLLAEAIWTRYMPSRQQLQELLESGVIGTPRSLTANLGYMAGHVPRLQQPSLSGGALLDIGVYPVNFASMAFGNEIERIEAGAVLTKAGVDEQTSMTFYYQDGRIAQLFASMTVQTDRRGIIYGSRGMIEVENINNCEGISVYNTARERVAFYKAPPQITGFEYQVRSCLDAIRCDVCECPEMPHAETIRMMALMDEIRAKCEVRYPHE